MADRKLALTLAFNGTGNLGAMMRRMVGESGQARSALKNLSDTAKAQKFELADLQRQLGSASGNVTDLLNKERALAAQMARTTTQIDRQKAAIARQGRADSMGQAATSSGMQNVTTGGTMAAGLFAVGKISSDFQDGMTDIQQKADLSAQETARMRSNIIAAARAAKQLPESMRQGVDTLSGFGMTPQQATQMIAPIGRAATAYRAEIADLAAASYANFSNLKVPIDQNAKAIDAMAMAGKMGAFEIKDMAMYFPALTAQAQSFGQTGTAAVSDLAAALQIARKATGDSATAANNLTNLMAKINTEETYKKFAKFGIDLPKAMKKAYAEGKTPIEAIAELSNKAVGGNLENLAFLFSDMQVQGALRPLIQNMEEYRKIRDAAMKATGVVDQDFALRSQNAAAQARALTGNLITMAMIAGDRILPAFVSLSEKALAVTDRFSAWAAANPQLLDLILKVVIGITALNLGLGASRLAFGAIAGPIMQAVNALIWLRNTSFASAIISGNFAAIGASAMGLGRALAAAGAFMMANPIILAIAALVALLAFAVPWIIKNWDALKAGFVAFFGSLATSFQPGIDAVTGFVHLVGSVWDRVKGPLAAGFEAVKFIFLNFTPLGWIIQAITPIMTWLRSIDWKGLGRMMIQGLIDGIFAMMGPLGAVFKRAAQAGIDAFKQKAQIKSPSRVFMGLGGYISEGLALGVDRGRKDPVRSVEAIAAGMAAALLVPSAMMPARAMAEPPPMVRNVMERVTRSGDRPSTATGGMGELQTLPTIRTISQLPPPAPSGGQQRPIHIGNLNIPVYAAQGQTPEDIAQEVMRLLREQMNAADARSRSSFDDED